jgi:hypothetical protein
MYVPALNQCLKTQRRVGPASAMNLSMSRVFRLQGSLQSRVWRELGAACWQGRQVKKLLLLRTLKKMVVCWNVTIVLG